MNKLTLRIFDLLDSKGPSRWSFVFLLYFIAPRMLSITLHVQRTRILQVGEQTWEREKLIPTRWQYRECGARTDNAVDWILSLDAISQWGSIICCQSCHKLLFGTRQGGAPKGSFISLDRTSVTRAIIEIRIETYELNNQGGSCV